MNTDNFLVKCEADGAVHEVCAAYVWIQNYTLGEQVYMRCVRDMSAHTARAQPMVVSPKIRRITHAVEAPTALRTHARVYVVISQTRVSVCTRP